MEMNLDTQVGCELLAGGQAHVSRLVAEHVCDLNRGSGVKQKP